MANNFFKIIAWLHPTPTPHGAAPLTLTQVGAKCLAAVVLDNQGLPHSLFLYHVWRRVTNVVDVAMVRLCCNVCCIMLHCVAACWPAGILSMVDSRLKKCVCACVCACVCMRVHACACVCMCVCVCALVSCCHIMSHSYLFHDEFICVPWLIYLCAMTPSHVCYDSFTCVPWHIYLCAMSGSNVCRDSFTHEPWPVHKRCVRCLLITERPKTPCHYRYQI